MNLDALDAFIAVAENESFSLAGEQLHLTQPAVSKRVASLEDELSIRLFDRIGRKVRLTEAGRQLLPRAEQMIQEMADIRRSISNLTGEIAGTLTMGTSHHIGLHRLPPALKDYSRRFPEVKLDIRFMDSETACAAVLHGSLELAIVTLPTEPIANLTIEEIWPDPLQFVVSTEHPLADLDVVTLEDLTHYQAVLVGESTYTRRIMEQALKPMGLKLQIGMDTNYFETLKMMVGIGLGWSLLPKTMVIGSGFRVLEIPEMQLSRQLGAVTHSNRTLSNAAQEMVDTCYKSTD